MVTVETTQSASATASSATGSSTARQRAAADPANLLDPEFLRRLEQLELVSRKIFQGTLKGERRSKRKGSSVEFADYRNYSTGDDLRHIDWNVYGRLDKLFLKLFLEEEDLHVYTLLDTSRSMDFGEPTKLHFGKQVAAALSFIGLVNQDRIVLESFSSGSGPALRGIRGRSQMWRIVQHLQSLQPDGGSDLTSAAKNFAARNPGKGIVVVISDFLDKGGYEDALRMLLARNLDIYVLQVLSRAEVEPELVGDLRLVDSEDESLAEITVSQPLLRRYKQNLDAFVGGLKTWCTKRGIAHLLTTTDRPFDQLVLNYLRHRGLVR